MYGGQRKSFDYKSNNYYPEEEFHHKHLGKTSPFINTSFEGKTHYQTNDKKYSYAQEIE